MRRLIRFALALCFATSCFAQTTTPNLGLILPAQNASNWGVVTNYNMSKLDTAYGSSQVPYQGVWSSSTTYNKGVFVSYLGNLYASDISGNLNNNPVSSGQWTEFVSASGLSDPGTNGFVYRDSLNHTIPGTLSQLISSFWSDSSCSTNQILQKNGTCTTAGSSGVASIDSQTGAFTFHGNVSHIGTSYTFSGAAYSSTMVDVFGGDSLGVVATTNTDTATAASCNGTTCQITVTTPSFYSVGQWINLTGGVFTYTLWSPQCLNFSIVKVTAISGSTVSFSEAQANTPGHSGNADCSGSVSGTGGTVQDASYFYPQQVSQQPYLTQGGTITPSVYNRAWPGASLADTDTNFATYFGDLAPNTTGNPANLFYFSDDICNNGSSTPFTASQFITHLQSIISQAHTDGFNVILMTIPEGPDFSCGIGGNGNGNPTFWAVNQWIRSNQCGETQARTSCADQIADIQNYAVNDRSNAYLVQQSGAFIGHLTNQGGTALANAVNIAMVAKNSFNSGGLAGYGYNLFNGLQVFTGTNEGGGLFYDFAQPSTYWITANGQDAINNLLIYRSAYNYLQFLQRSSLCWSENDNNTISDYASAPGGGCISEAFQGSANAIYSHKLAFGSGVFPSNTTQPTPGDASGGAVFQDWIMHGRSSDPTCSSLLTTDGALWYNSSSNQIKSCQNGAVVVWATGGTPFPGTNGVVYNTSTSASRNATASDISNLGYAADSGAANAYVVTLAPAISTSYPDGLTVQFNPANNSTASAPTLNVNGISADVITKNGGTLASGDIVAGIVAVVVHKGSNWQLQNPQTAVAGSVTLQGTSPITVNGDNSPHTGTSFTIAQTGGVANTTITTNTTLITANTCAAGPGSPVTMTGVTTSSVFDINPSTDTSGVTGWGATGGLVIVAWPTSNALNYKVCNQTAASITPGSSVTWNVGAH